MTAYSALAPEIRLLLAGMVFLSSLGELALCLYRALCTEKWKRCIFPIVIYLCLLGFLSVAIGARVPQEAPLHPIRLPWLCFPFLAVSVAVHSILFLQKEYRQSREQITSNSVREAIDRLDSGICFADENDRLILINRTMNRLGFTVTGRYPQTLSEMTSALERAENGISRVEGMPALYRFPDGKVWKFHLSAIEDAALKGFTQMTAQDMTELQEVNENLERENAAIRESIIKMRGMIGRMSDLAREQETLNLKMKIHNDIGASLISLSELGSGGTDRDAETQIAILERALAYFSSTHAAASEEQDELITFAARCGVELSFTGQLPGRKPMKGLAVAAVRECVTNCVRHAGGNRVEIKTTESGSADTVTITNNGKPPAAPITEGGGLSALRQKVEAAGGTMHIAHAPRFALTLTLTKGKDAL